MSPIEVPSFGFDEKVGKISHGDSFFPSVVVVADTNAGAVLGDVTFGVSAANAPMRTNSITTNNNGIVKRHIVCLCSPLDRNYFTVIVMVCEYSTHSMSPRLTSLNRFASGPIL